MGNHPRQAPERNGRRRRKLLKRSAGVEGRWNDQAVILDRTCTGRCLAGSGQFPIAIHQASLIGLDPARKFQIALGSDGGNEQRYAREPHRAIDGVPTPGADDHLGALVALSQPNIGWGHNQIVTHDGVTTALELGIEARGQRIERYDG